MHTSFRLGLISIFLTLLVGCSDKSPILTEVHEKIVENIEVKPNYSFDPQFEDVVHGLLLIEHKNFLNGQYSFIDEQIDFVKTTPTEIAEIYSANEVAGDQKFYGKLILISGEIARINSGIGNKPYIVFSDERLLGTQAHLADGFADQAASLQKNQSLSLVCMGKGVFVGTPVLKDCQFAEIFSGEASNDLSFQIEDFTSGKLVSNTAVRFSVLAEMIARSIDDEVNCSSGCVSEILEIIKSGRQKISRGDLLINMKAGGLIVDGIIEN